MVGAPVCLGRGRCAHQPGWYHLWVPRPPSRHTVVPISPRANQPSSRPSSRPAHQPIYQPNNHPTSQPTILPPTKAAYNFSCSGVSKGDGGLSGPRACRSTFVSGTQKWAHKPPGQRLVPPLEAASFTKWMQLQPARALFRPGRDADTQETAVDFSIQLRCHADPPPRLSEGLKSPEPQTLKV